MEKMTEYVNEIKSVFDGSVRIGYIARRSSIIGWADHMPDGWMITFGLSYPSYWCGNYKTRKEAVMALKEEEQVA